MKIEEGQAARRRAKARGEMGWPRFLSLKCECVDRPALPAGLWKSERIVREAMHESHEPSIGHSVGGKVTTVIPIVSLCRKHTWRILTASRSQDQGGTPGADVRHQPAAARQASLPPTAPGTVRRKRKRTPLGSVRLCRRPVRPGRGRAFSGAGPAPGTCLNDPSRLPGPGHRAVPRRGRSVPPAWPLRAPDGSHPVHPWR